MLLNILLSLIFLIFLNGGSEISNLSHETIKEELGGEVSIQLDEYVIPSRVKSDIQVKCRQAFFGEKVYFYRIFKGEELTNIAILDNVSGKSLPITFLVIFDLNGNVISSRVIKYREPYGGAVSELTWLRQFRGKNSSSGFEIGNDISAISGATISTNSLSKGIRKLVLLMEYIPK